MTKRQYFSKGLIYFKIVPNGNAINAELYKSRISKTNFYIMFINFFNFGHVHNIIFLFLKQN